MTSEAPDPIRLLDLEQLEVNLFRGPGDGGETQKRIFGGQVIAQALTAAYQTVEDRACHSLHAYFIRPGDPTMPIVFEVDRARDGGSFTTRRVIAVQKGRQIFNLAASFHIEEDGWRHQHDAPDVAAPDGLKSNAELRAEVADLVPEERRARFLSRSAIEIRPVSPPNLIEPKSLSDANQAWFRLARPVEASPRVHHCLLAYASDLMLMGSGLRPHGVTFASGQAMTASLDHALWFHGPINFNDWHLYSMDSPFAGGGRGFNRGSIFNQAGELVASVAQEGLMRPLGGGR